MTARCVHGAPWYRDDCPGCMDDEREARMTRWDHEKMELVRRLLDNAIDAWFEENDKGGAGPSA